MRPRVLLFDFGGTLDSDGIAWKERFAGCLAAEGVTVEASRFDPVFYASCDVLVGTVPRDLPLDGVVDRVASGLGAGLGLDAEVSSRAGRRFLRESRTFLRASRALLALLSRTFRIGVVSNFYGNLLHVLEAEGFGPCVSAVADSAVVGVTKPDPGIFRAALAPLGAPPEEALFVGDSLPRDMAGAKALGMPHVLLSASPGVAACCPDDRVIGRLAELPGLLGVGSAA